MFNMRWFKDVFCYVIWCEETNFFLHKFGMHFLYFIFTKKFRLEEAEEWRLVTWKIRFRFVLKLRHDIFLAKLLRNLLIVGIVDQNPCKIQKNLTMNKRMEFFRSKSRRYLTYQSPKNIKKLFSTFSPRNDMEKDWKKEFSWHEIQWLRFNEDTFAFS